MLSLPDICQRANEISEMGAPFVLEGLVFGSDDYLANIGKITHRLGLLYCHSSCAFVI